MQEFPFPVRQPRDAAAGTHLRHIALTVDEGDPGCFTWMLMESTGDAVVYDQEVAVSAQPFPSYSQALRAGYEALQALSQSSRDGPRAIGEDESKDPVVDRGDIGARRCR